MLIKHDSLPGNVNNFLSRLAKQRKPAAENSSTLKLIKDEEEKVFGKFFFLCFWLLLPPRELKERKNQSQDKEKSRRMRRCRDNYKFETS